MQGRETIFSPKRRYRYTLWRTWSMWNTSYCMFIGLNPSTADEIDDDPTVRRCISFAKSWGYGALCMTNAFAYRATDPAVMKAHPAPVGHHNDRYLREMAEKADVVVAAWGIHGTHLGRDREIIRMIPGLKCLGVTQDGQPKHPLYLSKTTELITYGGKHADKENS